MNQFDLPTVWQQMKRYRYWVVAAFVVLLLGGTLLLVGKSHRKNDRADTVTAGGKTNQSTAIKSATISSTSSAKPTKQTVKVDVKGAVKRPGLYEMNNEERLEDAVRKAGGFLSEQAVSLVNLAQRLEDGMVIYIPNNPNEQIPAINNVGSVPANEAAKKRQKGTQGGKVSLNSASQSELEQLSGVGPKKAEQIIAYREEHPFQSIEELKDLSGIGSKRFEQLKDQVQL